MDDLVSKIGPGQVFYFSDAAIAASKPHYFITVNSNPAFEKELILVCATTLDIWGAQTAAKFPTATFVELTPKECPFLKWPSLFDCNRPLIRHISILSGKMAVGKLKLIGQVSQEILEKLRWDIENSKLVPVNIKKALRI